MDRPFLDLFWKLSDEKEVVRIDAAYKILAQLKSEKVRKNLVLT